MLSEFPPLFPHQHAHNRFIGLRAVRAGVRPRGGARGPAHVTSVGGALKPKNGSPEARSRPPPASHKPVFPAFRKGEPAADTFAFALTTSEITQHGAVSEPPVVTVTHSDTQNYYTEVLSEGAGRTGGSRRPSSTPPYRLEAPGQQLGVRGNLNTDTNYLFIRAAPTRGSWQQA